MLTADQVHSSVVPMPQDGSAPVTLLRVMVRSMVQKFATVMIIKHAGLKEQSRFSTVVLSSFTN